MFNVCYRTHMCLGACPVPLGPLPRAPGAPPWGGVPAQTTTVTFPYTTRSACPKSMLILMSFFDRFGVDLGVVLGPCWGRLGDFVGSS